MSMHDASERNTIAPHWLTAESREVTRRTWLTGAARASLSAAVCNRLVPSGRSPFRRPAIDAAQAARVAAHAERVDPAPLYALTQRALDVARSAGASYADVRLTRTVWHQYGMPKAGRLISDEELVGIGVRVLANGSWGFAASPDWDAENVVQLATDAVHQAKANVVPGVAPVELASTPVVAGTWATPVAIDPFTVPIEDKLDHIVYWKNTTAQAGLPFQSDGLYNFMHFARQEQVLATSEGSRVMQTRYETGGVIFLQLANTNRYTRIHGIDTSAVGWELFSDEAMFSQLPHLTEELRNLISAGASKPVNVGRYTLVCDGTTMAGVLDATLGIATQLDRALGYEANAGGTSYLDDPLAMIGSFPVASPLVTVTANRSAPKQLATVQWDDEGVVPSEATLVNRGILQDFQTTRESAMWLAPYYSADGRPVRSNGHATAEGGLSETMQHMPNLAIIPSASAVSVDDLIANVKDGILIESGGAKCDFQGRTGMLFGVMRHIKNGRRDKYIAGGAIAFNSIDFWKKITALGGAATQRTYSVSQFGGDVIDEKGEPAQRTSHSITAPAALVVNQAIIDPNKKA
jgi:TldD protein